jgi:hypothetical protein
MAKPRAVIRNAAEADRLIRELNAKPGETVDPGTPPAPVDEAPPAPVVANDAAPADPAPPVVAEQPTAEPVADDFRQKYNVLRGKYDKEIPELKAQISELVDTNRRLEKMVEQAAEKMTAPAAKPSDKHYIKPEEREEYGEEFFDVVGRRTREVYEDKIAQLEAKLDRLTGQKTRLSAEEAKQQVFSALDENVPNWKDINGDQNFLAWLADRDVFSGRMKRELLSEAFENNDAARVVGFFKAFQEDSPAPAPAARTPSVDAGTLVAPGAPRAGAPVDAPGGGRIWTEQEIGQFYADCRRGKVSPEDRKRIEADIFKAAAEGRVR